MRRIHRRGNVTNDAGITLKDRVSEITEPIAELVVKQLDELPDDARMTFLSEVISSLVVNALYSTGGLDSSSLEHLLGRYIEFNPDRQFPILDSCIAPDDLPGIVVRQAVQRSGVVPSGTSEK